MKQVEVTILGQSYILACPDDGQAALLDAVQRVDREMSAIRDAGKVKARERIAVLAALNLAYRLAEQNLAAEAAEAASSAVTSTTSSAAARAEGPTFKGDEAAHNSALGADLDNLIRRLDEALAADGRLL